MNIKQVRNYAFSVMGGETKDPELLLARIRELIEPSWKVDLIRLHSIDVRRNEWVIICEYLTPQKLLLMNIRSTASNQIDFFQISRLCMRA